MTQTSTALPAAESSRTAIAPPQDRATIALIVLLLMFAGAFLRLHGLGRLGLVADEGYQALAVQAIHDHGGPRLDSGFVYLRAPLFLYTEAGVAWLIGMSEFSLRLPAVIFGVLCIPVGYLLGRELFDWRVGLLTAAMLALSAWEIEMSRYARFYTLFQAAYILALIFFYRGFIGNRTADRWWFFVAAFVAISVHELGLMLSTCFLVIVPLRTYSPARRLVHIALTPTIGLLWLFNRQWISRLARAFERLPTEVAAAPPGLSAAGTTADEADSNVIAQMMRNFPIKPPDFRFIEHLADKHPVFLTLIAMPMVAAAGYLLWRLIARCEWGRAALAMLITASAFTHQAALALIATVAYLAFFVRKRYDLAEPALTVAWLALAYSASFWLAWFIVNPGIDLPFAVAKTLSFPDLHRYVIHWLVTGWPILTVLLAVGLIMLGRRAVATPHCNGAWFAIAALAMPIVLTSAVVWMHSEARYFFHLYPIMLLIVACVIIAAADRLGALQPRLVVARRVGLAALVLALLFSADFNPIKSYSIGTRDYTSVKDPIRSVFNWSYYAHFHPDQKNPARYIRQRIEPGDRILAVGPPHKCANYRYYAGRLDYVISDPAHFMARRYNAAGHMYDPVVDARIIQSADELTAAVADASRLWILSDTIITQPPTRYLDESIKSQLAALPGSKHLGRDGTTFAALLVQPVNVHQLAIENP